MATHNVATSFYDSTIVGVRAGEVPGADWTGGTNRGASNASGIGIHTTGVPIDEDNWSLPAANAAVESGYIGLDSGSNNVVVALDPVEELWRNVGMLLTVAEVAVDAVLGSISGNDYLNRTSGAVPTATWAFGIKDS